MLQTPGLVPLYLASVLGRLPNGALGLVLVLRTREMTGSYASGGAVAAVYGLLSAGSQPLLGRVIDRRGQALVLVPAAVAMGAALGAFAALPDGTSTGAAAAVAAVVGIATPPLNSCLRALLSEAVTPALRHRAFALDSTLFELIYITGPLVIVGVIGAWSLRAAAAACAVLGLVGTLAFAATRLSRNARGAPVAPGLAGALASPGVRVLMVATGLFGASVANLEVGLAAFAEDEGHRNAVGYLLALSGTGSLCGGLVASRLPAPRDPVRRLLRLLVALTLLNVPIALMPSLPAMAVAAALSGVAIAPSLALAFQLGSETAPPGAVTEAMTWLGAAIAAGLAGGAALAGVLVEGVSTTASLVAIAAFTALQAAMVAAFRRPLTP